MKKIVSASILDLLPDDPLFSQQWHLHNTRGGYDLNLLSVWEDYSGYGVKVVVLDDGVQSKHSDLAANYETDLSYNFARQLFSGNPIGFDSNHGTAVAGIIAAEWNDQGVIGIAYNASLGSVIADFPSEITQGFNFAVRQGADIVNNSWGFDPFVDDPSESYNTSLFRALQKSAETGRDGLGLILTFAAGNEREEGYDANVNAINSSPYAINVAAIDSDGTISSYSSPGASILIAGLGGEGTRSNPGLTTVDRTGLRGYVDGDYSTSTDGGFNGTSAATPTISGVIALMLEANPWLGYRDVQEILAYSARISTPANKTWTYNGAGNWNGGGLHTSRDFGFGVVDTHAAVRLSETWDDQSTFDNLDTATHVSGPINRAIPDGNTKGFTSMIQVAEQLELDHVTATIHLKHEALSNLKIQLTSPEGTVSTLLDHTRAKPPSGDLTWTFTSTQFWGESSAGDWKLTVIDDRQNKTGALFDWSIKVWGDKLLEKELADDNLYVYTDEYGRFTRASDAARRLLSDHQGNDTINASAVTDAIELDLTPGGQSFIAGNRLTLDANTLIENAYTGDADDQVTGNGADNWLAGGRGDDTLLGNAGDDFFIGGPGNDYLNGGNGSDSAIYWNAGGAVTVSLANATPQDTGSAGIDTLKNIENLYGSNYNDFLKGNAGNNRLWGGLGSDTLVGGPGRDIFYYTDIIESGLTSSERDSIRDFSFAEGDRIDLSSIDDDFVFIGNHRFSGPGQLRFSPASSVLEGNIDRNLLADFSIELSGVTSLTEDAFIL